MGYFFCYLKQIAYKNQTLYSYFWFTCFDIIVTINFHLIYFNLNISKSGVFGIIIIKEAVRTNSIPTQTKVRDTEGKCVLQFSLWNFLKEILYPCIFIFLLVYELHDCCNQSVHVRLRVIDCVYRCVDYFKCKYAQVLACYWSIIR